MADEMTANLCLRSPAKSRLLPSIGARLAVVPIIYDLKARRRQTPLEDKTDNTSSVSNTPLNSYRLYCKIPATGAKPIAVSV